MRAHRLSCVALLFCTLAAHGREFKVSRVGQLVDAGMWADVRAALHREDVEVVLAPGTYLIPSTLQIRATGDPLHRLTIRGADATGTIFKEDPHDNVDRNFLLDLRDVKNVVVSNLHFRGTEQMGGAMIVRDSQDVTIRDCSWSDLTGAFYSALSIVGATTRDIRVDQCEFRRIGFDSHAHMIYSANSAQRLMITNNHFEDCAGEFVRFRNQTDYSVVYGCTFISTGTYKGAQHAMVSVPLFNDDDPSTGDPSALATQEYFGTHFIVAENLFRYAKEGNQNLRFAFIFHHSGFDPPVRSHLLTPDEAELLAKGPQAARRALLKQKMGIELEHVHLINNRYEHVAQKLTFRSYAAYGAKSKGVKKPIDLSDLANETPVVRSIDEALRYYAPGPSSMPATRAVP